MNALTNIDGMTERQVKWITRVEAECANIEAVSSGFCGGCRECEGDHGLTHGEEGYDSTDMDTWPTSEGHFSWYPCETCGCPLGGDRHAGHGLIPTDPPQNPARPLMGSELVHLSMCTDCVVYHANGDVPEDEHLDWLDTD